jgi:hypothetical protein
MLFPLVRKRDTTKLEFSPHIYNNFCYEQVKLEFLEKCKSEGLTKGNKLKVIGIYFPKGCAMTGGYFIEKNVTICILPEDTWAVVVDQLICEDVLLSTKRYFKHRIHSLNFGLVPEFCKYNKQKLNAKKKPYDILPDNSRLYIHQVMYKKGVKVSTKTCYKCKCNKCCPNLICCED